MKKFFAILLACAIIFSTLPVVVFADGAVQAPVDQPPVDQCQCDRNDRTGVKVRSVEATCTCVAYDVYKCEECELEYTVATAAALGHDDPQAQVTPPTCTEEGYTIYICQRDNCVLKGKEVKEDIVPALGHKYDAVVTAPTCTAGGYTTHTCSTCGDSYVDARVPAKGHNYEGTVTNPTCTTMGYTTYVCSDCGDTYTDDIVPENGHKYESAITTEPGCFTEGVRTYICTVCGDEYTEAIPPIGEHKYDVKDIDPTCTEYGKKEYTCTLCGYVLVVDNKNVPPVGHTNGAPVNENVVAPDCLNDGHHDEVVYCTKCNAEVSRKTIVDSAKGHNEEVIPGYDKTCVTDGLTDGLKCTVCGVITKDQDVIPASHEIATKKKLEPTCTTPGHEAYEYCTVDGCGYNTKVEIPANPEMHVTKITKAAQAATCVADGWTEEIYCTACEQIIAYSKVIPSDTTKAEQHKVVSTVVEPTCTEKGYTEYVCQNGCTDVNFNYKDAWVDALGHTEGTPVEENRREPDCVTDGGYDTVVYCTVCAVELSRVHTVLTAPGHDLDSHDAKEATCLEIGWKAYVTCKVCDYSTYEEIAPLGHDKGQSQGVVEPTCTTDGYTIAICTRCGILYETDPKTALGHKDAAAVEENRVEATCTVNGSYDSVVYCATCGVELSRTAMVIEAPGHTEGTAVKENNVEATCTTAGGYDTVVYCTVCNVELSRVNTVIDALGHKEVSHAAKDATCTEIGWNAYVTCARCSYTTYAEIPALGHDEVVLDAVAPTFDTTGLTEGKKCARCGEILVKQEVIPMLKEIIKFSYKATGKNGSNYATNSGEIVVEVWMTVTTEQARLWGIDFEVLFGDEVNLIAVGCDGTNFKTWTYTKADLANTNNVVKVTLGQDYGVTDVATFAKGDYKIATLTFKVDKDVYGQDVAFNLNADSFLVTRDEELTTKLPNELEITNGIDADKAEAFINVKLLGDANEDGVINGKDTMKMADWAATSKPESYDAVYDMDKNGTVDAFDLLDLAGAVVGNNEYLDK